MPDRAYLHPIDPELVPGARNAIDICLRLKPQERITIVTDIVTREIAAALQREVERVGSDYSLFVLEHHARRPLKFMPEVILDDLACSQVSILAAQTQPGELSSRTQMTAVVNNDRITCKTPRGTEFEAQLSPKLKWLKTSGIIAPDKWGNLPGGEIFTAPMNTNGTFVVDGVVGDYLCERFGDLESTPLTIEVENNRIRSLRSENKDLRDEFRAYTSTDENSNRVGEFAIGTNTACTHIIGHILQDEKLPGVHIAFGHPYAEHTGANWTAKTHNACVGRTIDIWFNGDQVMKQGKFLI